MGHNEGPQEAYANDRFDLLYAYLLMAFTPRWRFPVCLWKRTPGRLAEAERSACTCLSQSAIPSTPLNREQDMEKALRAALHAEQASLRDLS